VRHLRAHATQDADQRKVGKQTRYVEDIDVVIRYTLPPAWPEEQLSKFITDDDKWDLPKEDDALLIKILSAGYSPFFQRTGEFSKPSGVFKTPPLPSSQSRSPNNPTITIDPPTTVVPPSSEPDLEKGPTGLPKDNSAVPDRDTNKNIQPRRTYLPLFLSNFIHRVAGILLWFIPQSILRWWSPLHSKRPIGRP